MYRGNPTIKGYPKKPSATKAAFEGGLFHSGDIVVVDPDRYPAVMLGAVVAKPASKRGEVPLAFVELRRDAPVSTKERIEHRRSFLARYKAIK